MFDLEEKIVAWRTEIAAALSGRREAIGELEEHLRDQIEALCRTGKTTEEAFELAVKRLGRNEEIAREFSQLVSGSRSRWWLVRATIGLLLLHLLLGLVSVGQDFLPYAGLREVLWMGFAFQLSGFLAVFAAVLVGLMEAWRGPLWISDNSDVGPKTLRLAVAGSCMVPMLGAALWARKVDAIWAWQSDDRGLLVALVSFGLLLVVQWTEVLARPFWRIAPMGVGVVLPWWWLLTATRSGGVSIGWVLVAFIVIQLATAMSRLGSFWQRSSGFPN